MYFRIVKRRLDLKVSLHPMLQILSVAPFEKLPLLQILAEAPDMPKRSIQILN